MSDYGAIIGVQCPGTLGDSSAYNIDGRCFVSSDSESILCGKFVTVKGIVEGYKEITDKFGVGSVPYGVALRTHMNTFVDDEGYMAYESADPINVISHGRAWVLSQDIESSPTFGTLARCAKDGFASLTGEEIAGWHYTGGWQKFSDLFYIVEVQLIQSAPYIFEGQKVLVNGAVLEANLPSPQAPNKVITITVDVSPKTATDKTGEWSVDEEGCVISPISDTQAHLSVADSASEIPEVHVVWTANDGSKVAASLEYSFQNALP